MSASAVAAPPGRALTLRGTRYPVLLPTLGDPRLHLAAVIISLQVLGQVAFDFRVSIAQILIALGVCALLEFGIAFWRQHLIMWPASALITGNGVAFILRVPGTQHGDWWSLNGWWIYAATAAGSLLSKHVIRFRGRHIFNPSNIGLVVCFLLIGPEKAEPLDFWWGPMSAWMVVALVIIVAGGVLILSRVHLLEIAVVFWLAFATAIGVLAATGHAMTANWHLGPITGASFWLAVALSPEILVFLFFMITDPKTTPSGRRPRIAYAVAVALLAALLIAPARTEFWSKVAVLGSLAIVCAARPLVELFAGRLPRPRDRGRAAAAGIVAAAACAGLLVVAGLPARSSATADGSVSTLGHLPQITILPSKGVQSTLDRPAAQRIARDLLADLDRRRQSLIDSASVRPRTAPTYRVERMDMWLERGTGQQAAVAVARLQGVKRSIVYAGSPAMAVERAAPAAFSTIARMNFEGGRYVMGSGPGVTPAVAPLETAAMKHAAAKGFAGVRLTNVANRVGLNFRQDDFRFGTSYDVHSMMGGGVCWLDYNNDGWLDLFAVNSFSDADRPTWTARGGLPRSALYENVHGHFVNVGARAHANIPVQGNGCVAADFGNGYPSLLVTTNVYNVLLWNNGNGTFTNITHEAGIDAFGTFGWHTGAAVADVNGDGRPDIFVSGYADVNAPSQSSGGFPANYQAFRDLLYLNEGLDARGHPRFKEVSLKAGIETKHVDHSLGAVFVDVNGDGRPDLYVANDLDPNRLYLNEPGGPLGFHFVDAGTKWGVADPGAGMGIAAGDYSSDGRPDLFVTNSRGQTHAVFRSRGASFVEARSAFAAALGGSFTGWGDSWADLNNDGYPDLVVANGAIPVTNLAKDAGRVQVLENLGGEGMPGRFASAGALVGVNSLPRLNGRGVAAADYDNDGRVDLAINSIGGRLVLLRTTGPTGHWLEVKPARFSPGATVTAVLPSGRRLTGYVLAGSSYLSSEDPRVHFGLGDATEVKELIVHYPGGGATRLENVRADRIVTVGGPR
jgi:Na+-translocating ferredoxin:NAD+ oxidoreductase RnfD subunit